MIALKSSDEMAVMDRCNSIVLGVLSELRARIAPGTDVADLDAYAEARTLEQGARPAFKGYQGFPSTLCVSINEQVVHGIPRRRVLEEGDLVSLDFGVVVDGLFGDGAETVPVGRIAPDHADLLDATRQALADGIAAMQPGATLGDVGAAVQQRVESRGYSVVREYVGHGIGRALHENPQLPNHGTPGRGARLEPGMVLAIEPMVNAGTARVKVGQDQWTVTTADGQPSAHMERSVAITQDGPWILGAGLAPGQVSLKLPEAKIRKEMA